jgi:hypothetical protein
MLGLFLVFGCALSRSATRVRFRSKTLRPPSPTSLDDTDPTDYIRESNVPALITGLLVIAVVGGIGFYVYLRRKWEEANNPEYTRAILGDDAYEFSELEAL